ncbi:NmrA/HSCARG family protein [Saccharomonospora sp. NPDC006951]
MTARNSLGPASPVVVIGATGKQGGATARRLLAGGRPVRALVRDPAAPAATALAAAGARLVRGDLDDRDGLLAALDGATALFAIPPMSYEATRIDPELEVTRGRRLIDAATETGVEQVVFSTIASMSADSRGREGKARIERYLFDRVALPTVLRPVRFMTNYLGSMRLGLDSIDGSSGVDGVHRHLFPPHEPMQVIALEDIAEFAALAFADPARFAGRTLELAGDQPTPVEAAAAISEATGIPVRYEQLSDDKAAALGQDIAETKRRWLAGDRWHADIETLRVIHPGLRSFTGWLAESGATAIREHILAQGVTIAPR